MLLSAFFLALSLLGRMVLGAHSEVIITYSYRIYNMLFPYDCFLFYCILIICCFFNFIKLYIYKTMHKIFDLDNVTQ